MKLSFFVFFAALVALSASVVSATANVKFIIDQDNSSPFFIGADSLISASSAMSTATSSNPAVSSVLDAALSAKYDSATVAAWRRLMSNNATLVATAGPALSGDIKCFVGANGEVVGLQYGSALVCQSSSRVVNVKIGTNYISNIKVVLGPNAIIAGLQFIVTNGVSGSSTTTYCGTKNGLSAFIGRSGKAVGALGGTCSAGTAGRRRLAQNNNGTTTTTGLVGGTFTSIVTTEPQGSNDSPPFSPSTTFTVNGNTVSGGSVANGTSTGRRLRRMRRALLAALQEN